MKQGDSEMKQGENEMKQLVTQYTGMVVFRREATAVAEFRDRHHNDRFVQFTESDLGNQSKVTVWIRQFSEGSFGVTDNPDLRESFYTDAVDVTQLFDEARKQLAATNKAFAEAYSEIRAKEDAAGVELKKQNPFVEYFLSREAF